jgi:hypothetical protein
VQVRRPGDDRLGWRFDHQRGLVRRLDGRRHVSRPPTRRPRVPWSR